ncbi:MAG TPA: type 1 glutamine amidotransferase, partial [Burkholderiaceae bacterium]|nr:type 1 glutamine amidotransferase [Burkholderiaceae bacterium]
MKSNPMRLSLIQHHPAEGPGEIAHWATARGVDYTIFRADLEQLPDDQASPVLLLGGPYGAHDTLTWLQTERRWLQQVAQGDAAILAICLGAQLLTLALGGEVHKMERPEVGWNAIQFTDGGQHDMLQWHEDMCILPPGATLLAENAHCRNQQYAVGLHRIALQFHAEWNADSVSVLNAFFGAASPLP